MDQIYSATYSGVDVLEFIHPQTGSVMRRKADGWVNATHILKTANFPKAKRTRILERDVQTGEHEKVQGGYGKYQGTWVPLTRAIEISKEFNVNDILEPLFNWRPSSGTPPPAPKHHHASKANSIIEKPPSQRKAAIARKIASMPARISKSENTSISKEKKKRGRPKRTEVTTSLSIPLQQSAHSISNPNEGTFVGRRLNSTYDATPQSLASSPMNSITIDPNQLEYTDDKLDIEDGISSDIEDGNFLGSSSPSEFMSDTDLANALKSPNQRINQSARESLERAIHTHSEHIKNMNATGKWYDTNAEYTSRLLEYFMSPEESSLEVPDYILNPPKGINFDEVIDEDGNTAFLWACAMGNSQVVESWINLGANYRTVNNLGENALMRSVSFTNSYSKKTFPKLVELLTTTIFEFDSTHKTVLHHIAAAATSRSRKASSVYYMDILLAKIAQYQPHERLEGFLNLQDTNGDSALHICAKHGNRKCIKLLLEYKADHSLKNNKGLTPSVLLLDNDNITPKVQQRYETHLRNQAMFIPEPHYSEAAIDATHKVSNFIIDSLNDLSYAYDHELQRKESDVLEVKELLANMNDDIKLTELKTKEYLGEDLSEEQIQQRIRNLNDQVERTSDLVKSKEGKLRKLIERSQVKELNKLFKIVSQHQQQTNDENSLISDAVELTKLQIKRMSYIEQIIEYQGGLNESNEKMQKYKRLISGCTNFEIDQVFDKVDELLDEIEKGIT